MCADLHTFDPEIPIERAWTPPSSWYVDPDALAHEAATVFARNWVCVALASAVADAGTYLSCELMGRHYLVVRDEAATLRAFHNVCRHHAARLAGGSGTCETLVCPYHGWTYALDGALLKAPRAGGIRDFDLADFRLKEVAVREWGPLLFVRAGEAGRDLDADLDGAADLAVLSRMRHVATREYAMRCNWKVFVDNYLDGGYHVPVLHRELAGHLELDGYRTEIFERYSVQSCGALSAGERLGAAARYAWIYPNLMLNAYGPIVDVNRVVPVTAGETRVVFDWFFEPERAADAEFVERSIDASERVQREDVAICESVQTGLASPAYDRGRYAPRLEAGEHHFHRLLSADLRRGATSHGRRGWSRDSRPIEG